MGDENEEPIFEEGDLPSAEEVTLEVYAQMVATLYRALKGQDLSVQEAASLAAAIISHTMPHELKGPQDGS